jgi:3-isopropylmalate dehydratase small subunit
MERCQKTLVQFGKVLKADTNSIQKWNLYRKTQSHISLNINAQKITTYKAQIAMHVSAIQWAITLWVVALRHITLKVLIVDSFAGIYGSNLVLGSPGSKIDRLLSQIAWTPQYTFNLQVKLSSAKASHVEDSTSEWK